MAEHLEFENELWKAANRLRGSIESSQYKHIVLALMFLKYISDSLTQFRHISYLALLLTFNTSSIL